MSDAPTYLLDANCFIEAKKRYYAFPICPGFWEALVWHHGYGSVWSIDRVRAELVGYGDDLSEWVKDSVPATAFHSTNDDTVAECYADLVRWVMDQDQYMPGAKAEFAEAKVADAWLIAYARVNGMTLVTHETYDEKIRRKVKIPNVCLEFDVPYLDSFDMLGNLGCQFTWACP